MNRFGAIRAGYSHDQFERHGRGFSDVGDNIFRVSYDAFANQYFTIRAAFEGSQRRGDGFVESGVDYEGVGGTQEGLRYYDEADRDRRRTLAHAHRHADRDVSTSASPTPAAATSS